MYCLRCQNLLDISTANPAWVGFKSYPVVCNKCLDVSWVKTGDEKIVLKHTPVAESIPPLMEYTKVYVVNREHAKFLEPGTIIARDHIHYRVKFEDRVAIWMPSHWIVAIPGELL